MDKLYKLYLEMTRRFLISQTLSASSDTGMLFFIYTVCNPVAKKCASQPSPFHYLWPDHTASPGDTSMPAVVHSSLPCSSFGHAHHSRYLQLTSTDIVCDTCSGCATPMSSVVIRCVGARILCN